MLCQPLIEEREAGIHDGTRRQVLVEHFLNETPRFFHSGELERIIELRSRFSLPPQTSEQDAILLWTTERVFDALGQGEIQSLGLDQAAVIESMVEKTHAFLE